MKNILKAVDHTLLKATASEQDIVKLCDEAIKMNVASVCVPPCYVKFCKEYLGDKIPVCTVIGFPLGYQTKQTKIFETRDAILNGADEIDMVVNICDIKSGKFKDIESEIEQIKLVVGNKILKVIIETCYLTDEEKIKMCEIVTNAKADFIKTSTGFGTAGAILEDIKLFKKHIGQNVKIKAAGGIKSLKDAEDFISEGVSRLGTSSICKIMNKENATEY